MGIAGRIGIAVVTAALAAGSGAGRAAEPPQPSATPRVNEGLLEFLGSADPVEDSTPPDDGTWLAYLSQVDIGKVAKASSAPQGSTPPKPAAAAANTDKPNG